LDHVLAGMVRAGQGIEALCLYLDLDREALFDRIVELGLATPHDRPLRRSCNPRRWLPPEVRQLIGCWIAGVRGVSIAGELGRSPGAIYGKAKRLGLPKRDRKALIALHAGRPDNGSVPVPATNGVARNDKPGFPAEAASVVSQSSMCGTIDLRGGEAVLPPLAHPIAVEPSAVVISPETRPRRRRAVWSYELDWELSLRCFSGQHPNAIAREMAHYGVTASALASRFTRLELPRRVRADLVDRYDPALAERIIRETGYRFIRCPFKKHHFWTRNRGARFSEAGKKSAEYRALSGGIG
jgi:hypothetical protein